MLIFSPAIPQTIRPMPHESGCCRGLTEQHYASAAVTTAPMPVQTAICCSYLQTFQREASSAETECHGCDRQQGWKEAREAFGVFQSDGPADSKRPARKDKATPCQASLCTAVTRAFRRDARSAATGQCSCCEDHGKSDYVGNRQTLASTIAVAPTPITGTKSDPSAAVVAGNRPTIDHHRKCAMADTEQSHKKDCQYRVPLQRPKMRIAFKSEAPGDDKHQPEQQLPCCVHQRLDRQFRPFDVDGRNGPCQCAAQRIENEWRKSGSKKWP